MNCSCRGHVSRVLVNVHCVVLHQLGVRQEDDLHVASGRVVCRCGCLSTVYQHVRVGKPVGTGSDVRQHR